MKTIKQMLITVAVLLCNVAVKAHDFEVDGIYYNIISASDLTVKVTYKGDSYDEISNEYSGEVVIPSTVSYKSKTLTVTSIGDRAFYGCSGLTSVTIPNSVTSIGERAFGDCSRLTSVTIGDGVTSIGEYAFYYCSGLTSIEIPGSVTSIGEYAFYYCSGLTSIEIPNSVMSIGDYAFCGCENLTSLTIPNKVKSIRSSSFRRCSKLENIVVDNNNPIYDSRNDCNGHRNRKQHNNFRMQEYYYT